MLDRKLFSANFKRDYVTMAAVVLFIGIVCAEIILAVGIPMLIRNSNLYAVQETRQRMLDEFDDLRKITVAGTGEKVADAELKLLRWNLDLLAIYLRANAGGMSRGEIAELRSQLLKMQAIVLRLREKKQPYCRAVLLDPGKFLDTVAARVDEGARRASTPTPASENE